MTPYKHAESSAKKWGGTPEDYIDIHNWFDQTKSFTGDFTHRALRHHSAGVEWSIDKFGHSIMNSEGRRIPVKLVSEIHIIEDCGFIPTPQDWLVPIEKNPEEWMLKVNKKSKHLLEISDEEKK